MKDDSATPLPECHEGLEAFQRFDDTMGKLLSISHATLAAREKVYKEQSLANPRRSGPKPKVKRRRRSS